MEILGAARAMTSALLDLDGRVFDRRAQLTEFRDAVDEARRTGGGCVLLSGAPGVGKSALTEAFGFEITGRNYVSPYTALGEALRAIVREMESTGPAEATGGVQIC